MRLCGSVREFESPPLVPGRTYTYEVHARWVGANCREVVRNRTLTVRAGDRLEVDLNAAPAQCTGGEEERPTLRTQPLPLQRNAPPPGD
jgi:uncharacterized protein (TIGR03000 family)